MIYNRVHHDTIQEKEQKSNNDQDVLFRMFFHDQKIIQIGRWIDYPPVEIY